MDPLSDVLRAVRLDGAFFYYVEARHPWAVQAVSAVQLVPRVLPEAEHLISYHILIEGLCWAGLADEPQVALRPGDAIVFPHGDPHVLASSEGRRLDSELIEAAPERYLETVRIGGESGARAAFVCGFLGCDLRPFNPVLAGLPRLLHVAGVTQGWLSEFPRQLVTESRQPSAGGVSVLTRMAELMFLEVLRRHLDAAAPLPSGWLAGLRDPVVAPVLTLLHERPAHPWTLAELAQKAATSRTVLAERFSQTVGVPPMHYLAQWRLQLAAEQLATGAENVGTIGLRVGYESEAAFSRAFKRATGQSPRAWRREKEGR